ncbi:MAG: NAD(P)H-binding protein [Brachymonas sp.]|jgi:uncharacterized protein YbjT (DUF2867 family)
MNIVLLGATGTTGQLLLALALRQGHRVTAFGRNALQLPAQPNLQRVQGEVEDCAHLQAVFAGADAVISCLGQRPSLRAFCLGSHFQRQSLPAIIAAINAAQVPRFVLQSSFGAGASAAQAGWLLRTFLYGLVAKKMFDDKAIAEQALAQCQANWTAVYPVTLVQKPAMAAVDMPPLTEVRSVPGVPRLPFANVAAALLDLATQTLGQAPQHAQHAEPQRGEKLLLTPAGSWRK